MDKEVILQVKDLHIEFHDRGQADTAVEDFDLTLERGEIVGIVGESGSGKSMSALAIAGLLRRRAMMTRSGEILFDGHNLLTCDRDTLRRYQGDEISIIFQEPMTSLNPLKKIGWQVEESLRIHHPEIGKAERRERALQMMRDIGLRETERLYQMYPHELSGGMRQRIMIAAAMIGQPKILIADEPTTALDVTTQAHIVELLRKLNEEHQTAIIFISHDLSLVSRLCERVIVMRHGRIVESGAAEEIFHNPREDYTKELIAAIPVVDLTRERGRA